VLDIIKAAGRLLGWRGVDWVIAGGESGPGAEPSHPDWFRSLRDQCQAADVPYLFKQWGAWLPLTDRVGLDLPSGQREWRYAVPDAESHEAQGAMVRVGKKAASRLLDGRTWDEMPKLNDDTRRVTHG
jgi:protein gp37